MPPNKNDGNKFGDHALDNRVASPSSVVVGSSGGGGGGIGGSVGLGRQSSGLLPYPHQPQSQHQHANVEASASPPRVHPASATSPSLQQQQQGGGSSSLMSRAGLTSVIQRMGVSSTRSLVGSGHGSTPSPSRRSKSSANQNSHNQQQQHSSNPYTPPRGAGGYKSPTSNGVLVNQHSNSIHHCDLSPESKARKQAMMMKRKQEQKQQQQQMNQQQPSLVTQESSSSYHTASGNVSSDKIMGTIQTSDDSHIIKTPNTSNVTNNNISSSASGILSPSQLAQGVGNLSLSSGQQQQSSKESQTMPPQPRSPSSPRAELLKKMQNNDEEDWEKAWAEDSESDDDEDDDGGESSAEEAGEGTKMRPALPMVPSLAPSSVSGAAVPTTAGMAAGRSGVSEGGVAVGMASSPLPYRPDVDSGHSSASIPVMASPMSAMHSAFTPTKPQQPGSAVHPQKQQQIQQQQQQAEATPSSTIKTIKTPIIQYPPVQPKSQFASPEFPTSHQDMEEDAQLLQQANEALQDGQQGWDSYIRQEEEEVDERPCVDMFEPALRVLGRGSFGRVVLVQKRHGLGTGALYAMKILRKSHLVRRRQIERTKTERKVLSKLDHPFIMKMYYAFQTTEKLFLVLDYCPGGELFFHLSRYRRFQEPVARFYAAELLLAIGHLHKNGIIYRDLKPENVLLDAYGHVKLGDFGLAKDGIRHPTQGAKSTCGTPEYMAPEVLNQGGHGFCVDYWGLGMILYEMMTGLPPWYTTDRSKLFRRLRSAPLIFPKEVHFTPHCRACIAGLLEREPRLRLGVMGLRSAMRHEFFYRRINFEALRAQQIAAPIRPCEGWRQFTQNSRNNSIVGDNNDGLGVIGGGWHSAGPSLDSATMGGITAEALDVATANFDDSFRRMPIETEDYEKQQQAAGHPPISEKELNAQTFRGFTFDGDLPQEEAPEEESHQMQTHHQNQPSTAGRLPHSHHGNGGG